ncbi:MAG: hypothetical protein LBT70_01170 [Holosporaceae bacterium]|jgi:hypothetical protein|nr:hypothetical protein [Holosporaceae bacterium]
MKKTLLSLFLLVGMCSNIYAMKHVIKKDISTSSKLSDEEKIQILSSGNGLSEKDFSELLRNMYSEPTPSKPKASSSTPKLIIPEIVRFQDNQGHQKSAFRIGVAGDGNCGYTALGITRGALADTLLKMLTNSATEKFVKIHIAAQILSSSMMNEKFKKMKDNVEKENAHLDTVRWYINNFIRLTAQEFGAEYAGEYEFINYMDLSETDTDNRKGLGHLLATVLQKKINIISLLNKTVITFEPLRVIPAEFTLEPGQRQEGLNNELWLLHGDVNTHYDVALIFN